MKSFNLKQRSIDLKHINCREAFNVIDELFITVLSKARSAVKGPAKTLSYSQNKLEVSSNHLH